MKQALIFVVGMAAGTAITGIKILEFVLENEDIKEALGTHFSERITTMLFGTDQKYRRNRHGSYHDDYYAHRFYE